MKYSLVLDSSTTLLSVGLINEEEIFDSVSYECWQAQSEHMIPEINALLEKYSINNDNIESVYVALGPGSYTGVRIAVTIAKTLAAALKCKVYPFSSLQALKDDNNPSICLINARSSRSYIGVYHSDKCLLNDCIMTNEQVLNYIKDNPNYSVCGNTKYLGIEGKVTDLVKQIFLIKDNLKEIENPLALSPVYMKD